MLSEFTKSEIKQFYRLSRSVTEVSSGFAISPHSIQEGKEILIIPRELPVTPDTDDPIDITTPFCFDRACELLRAYQADQLISETYSAALRFGTHWRTGRRSMFQIKDPLQATHMQLLLLREKPEHSGWMDPTSSAEDRLAHLADYAYHRSCPNTLVLHGFIIPCDHDSEPLQQSCSQEWRALYK